MDKKVYKSNPDEVFYVVFTPKLAYKTFYKFFATTYEYDGQIVLFKGAKIPFTILSDSGPIQVAQDIRAPELTQKSASIFIYNVKKPEWFDITEDQVITGEIQVQSKDSRLQGIIQEQVYPVLQTATNS